MIFLKAYPDFKLNIIASNQYNVDAECLNYILSLDPIFDKDFKLSEEPDKQIRLALIKQTIEYLNVEKSARYQPLEKKTFCNIYVHDFCHLLGVYLPRIWWKEGYLEEVNYDWKKISIIYGATIVEQNCNMLFQWLNNFGRCFNWVSVTNTDYICQITDEGTIGLAIAKNVDLNKNGHVSILLPNCLKEGKDTEISILQSEAGRINRQYFYGDWWSNKDHLDIEFWYVKINK